MTDAGAAAAERAELKASTAELEPTCAKICEHSSVLHCKNADQCALNCVAAATGTPCNDEFRAFYQCLVTQPAANWECSEDGVAAVREGFCDKPQERAITCMDQKAAH